MCCAPIRDAALGLASRTGPVARRMAGAVSGIDLAYAAPPGAHPLVGRRAPDVHWPGTRPDAVPRATTGPVPAGRAPRRGHEHGTSARLADRVDLVVAGGPTRTVVLVRPDGYIAWAGDDTDPWGEPPSVRRALAEWCGPSADRVAH